MSEAILLLGGSEQQVIAIETAKRLGYRAVLCDYLPDNPGQEHADVFYQTSTTDKDAVLEVARKEGVRGVLAYASDPAAPTAAYVAEELSLPGVPYRTARAFCEKHLFRRFLDEHGFNRPGSATLRLEDGSWEEGIRGLRFPVVVKPTDASGSKGVNVVCSEDELPGAVEDAARFSRNGVLVAEEFIVRDHPHVIEAELFVVNGTIESWGLMNSIRDEGANPLLPAGYSIPLDLPPARKELVRTELQRLVEASGVSSGAFNIEMVVSAEDRLYFLDAGPRNGGNMLPDLMTMASGKDIVEATVLAAMGKVEGLDVAFDGESGGFWGLSVLHSAEAGSFAGVAYSDLARECLVREHVRLQPGDKVSPFARCTDLVGLSFFRFGSKSDMDRVMLDMAGSVSVEVLQ